MTAHAMCNLFYPVCVCSLPTPRLRSWAPGTLLAWAPRHGRPCPISVFCPSCVRSLSAASRPLRLAGALWAPRHDCHSPPPLPHPVGSWHVRPIPFRLPQGCTHGLVSFWPLVIAARRAQLLCLWCVRSTIAPSASPHAVGSRQVAGSLRAPPMTTPAISHHSVHGASARFLLRSPGRFNPVRSWRPPRALPAVAATALSVCAPCAPGLRRHRREGNKRAWAPWVCCSAVPAAAAAAAPAPLCRPICSARVQSSPFRPPQAPSTLTRNSEQVPCGLLTRSRSLLYLGNFPYASLPVYLEHACHTSASHALAELAPSSWFTLRSVRPDPFPTPKAPWRPENQGGGPG